MPTNIISAKEKKDTHEGEIEDNGQQNENFTKEDQPKDEHSSSSIDEYEKSAVLEEVDSEGIVPPLVFPGVDVSAYLKQLFANLFSLSLLDGIKPHIHSPVPKQYRFVSRVRSETNNTYLRYFPFLKVRIYFIFC